MQLITNGYYTVYSTVNTITRNVANKGLAVMNLQTVEHYEAIAKVKFITAVFVCVKHFLMQLLVTFPMDFEAQKSLMLYLILPSEGGLFASFASALNPSGFDFKSLGNPINFLKGVDGLIPTSAGHAALTLATDAWANTLKSSNLNLSIDEQKKLLASITQPLPLSPMNMGSIVDPLGIAGELAKHNPLGLIKNSPLDLANVANPISLAKSGMDLTKKLNPLEITKLPQLGSHLPDLHSPIPSGLINNNITNGLTNNITNGLTNASTLFGTKDLLKTEIPIDKPLGHHQLTIGLNKLQEQKESLSKLPSLTPPAALENLNILNPISIPKPKLLSGFGMKGHLF